MALLIFTSNYSISKSLLTLDKVKGEIDINSPISLFSICKKHGMNILRLADYNMSGFFEAYTLSIEYNIQLIFGLQVRVVNNLDDSSNDSASYITIWMKNTEGYKDLLVINQFINNQGYRHPYASIDWKNLNEVLTRNLLVTIPFYSSFLATNLMYFGKHSIPLIEDFNPIFFTENHGLPFDLLLQKEVEKFCKDNYYDCLPTHTTYYYNNSHAPSLQVLRCINNRTSFEDPELTHFSSDQFSLEQYIKNYGENYKYNDFDKYFVQYDIKSLTNGVRLPEIEIDTKDKERLGLPENVDNYTYLSNLVALGLKEKVLNNPNKKHRFDEYVVRCKEELDTFKQLYIVDYILLVYDVIKYARENNIPIGPARGSSAGSSVSNLIGIVDIDPLDYGLYFSRFISPARAQSREIDGVVYLNGSSLPDIDTDVSFQNRYKIIDYINNKYQGKTCKIGTLTTLSAKILIKEVSKVYLNYSETDAQYLANMIDKVFGSVFDLSKALEESKELKKWVDSHPSHLACFNIAKNLEGLIKSHGVHPSGICISYDKIDKIVPLIRTADGSELASAYDMQSVANLTVKVDILGLRTVDVIHDTCKLLNIDSHNINVNDKSIYDFLKQTDSYHGLFQIEKGLSKSVAMKVKPDNINDFAACVALSRPGCFKFIDDYVQYKEEGEYKSIHPIFDEILKKTGGILIYQEQINEICQKVFKMSGIQADQVRYYIGKKRVAEMKAMQPKIYEIGKSLDIPEEATTSFFQICEDSASYLFNFSHSVAYGTLSAITTYLKANYPLQFFVSLLNIDTQGPESLSEIAIINQELNKFDIKLLPPNIKESSESFSIENNNIRFGLGSIKGISEAAIKKLASFDRSYATKFDLFNNCLEAKLGLNVVKSLIAAGCFPNYNHSRAKLLLEFQIFNKLTEREKILVNRFGEMHGYDLFSIIKYLADRTDEDGRKYIKSTRLDTIRKSYENYYKIYQFNKQHGKLLNVLYEHEVLGYSYSGGLATCYREEYPEIVSLYEVNTALEGEILTFIARVRDTKEGKSRAKQTPYVKLFLWDEQSGITAMIFGDKTKQVRDKKDKIINEDVIVVANGRKMSGDMIFLNWIRPLFDLRLAKRISDTE